jgi:hypothetical protein
MVPAPQSSDEPYYGGSGNSTERSHRGSWILLGAGTTVGAIVVILLVLALILPSSTTLVSSDFNAGKGPFAAESDPHVTLQYALGKGLSTFFGTT